ncbi:hypothetical protein [Carboxydothermus pertinax]|uniref:Uncharacterized protein n=1 Tax=Carboxydothermus pertinax TaxID=870242 RepID=A0A1L8CW96_9THEO|nr:hypothetical protein [Carboxydothermus pertinax]GAV23190.1 hypothetical protein cpu_17000 [Carboxydothermus pertinax]
MELFRKYKSLFLASVITILLLAIGLLFTGAYSDIDNTLLYEAMLRNDELPKINELNGKTFIKNKIQSKDDNSDLKLKVKLPKKFNNDDLWQNVEIQLKSDKKSIPVNIIPEQSFLKNTTLSNGDLLRWGAITGEISFEEGKSQTVVIGVFEIPSKKMASFTFALHAGNGNPPVALSFGNLTPNEEILQIIKENKTYGNMSRP